MGTAPCSRVAQHSSDEGVVTFVPKPFHSGAVQRHTQDLNISQFISHVKSSGD